MSRFGQATSQRLSSTTGLKYSSAFPNVENPLSEGGRWVNNGLDWTVCATTAGLVFGTMTGHVGGGPFNDSYANLTGFNANDCEITTTIFKGTTSGIQEVEHRFRCSDGAHLSSGYEVNMAHDGQYLDCVYWPGPSSISAGDFVPLFPSLTFPVPGGVANGDLFRSRIVGATITAWVKRGSADWVLVFSVTDTTGPGGTPGGPKAGLPGIGFYKESGSGSNNQFGFSNITVVGL